MPKTERVGEMDLSGRPCTAWRRDLHGEVERCQEPSAERGLDWRTRLLVNSEQNEMEYAEDPFLGAWQPHEGLNAPERGARQKRRRERMEMP